MKIIRNWRGVLYGTAYGLVSRAIFSLEDFRYTHPSFHTLGLMTVSFMFIVPLVVGLIVAYNDDTITNSSKIVMITTPVFAIVGLVVFAVLSGQEGLICALMALPVFMIMSLIGGFIGIKLFKRNKNKLYVSVFVLLPFFVAPIENKLELTEKIFTENTSIEINAGEKSVWNNITRVKEISDEENNYSLFQFMGFPRPIEAKLDTVAVGGVRKALFARGLFFTETVTQMEPLKILVFDIKADPKSIPPKALDEHVMVGGKYFEVLQGKYEIKKITNKKVILYLTSEFRLSTMFNFYSGVWSKIIMKDIQENILNIIKRRCEGEQKRA